MHQLVLTEDYGVTSGKIVSTWNQSKKMKSKIGKIGGGAGMKFVKLRLSKNHGGGYLYLNIEKIEAISPEKRDGKTASRIFTDSCVEEGTYFAIEESPEKVLRLIDEDKDVLNAYKPCRCPIATINGKEGGFCEFFEEEKETCLYGEK